jgi:hypothetical protein
MREKPGCPPLKGRATHVDQYPALRQPLKDRPAQAGCIQAPDHGYPRYVTLTRGQGSQNKPAQRKNTSGAFLTAANGVADLGSRLNFPKTDAVTEVLPAATRF